MNNAQLHNLEDEHQAAVDSIAAFHKLYLESEEGSILAAKFKHFADDAAKRADAIYREIVSGSWAAKNAKRRELDQLEREATKFASHLYCMVLREPINSPRLLRLKRIAERANGRAERLYRQIGY